MDDKEKFIVRISCDPKITPTDIGAKFVDKMLTLRAEKVNEIVISQLRDLMKEKGINELIAIDESKVLEMVKNAQALEIIKRTHLNVGAFMILCKGDNEYAPNTTYEQYVYFCEHEDEIGGDKMHSFPCYRMTKEEYELVLEVLYGKDRVGN